MASRDTIQSHKEPSMRFEEIKRRPTLEHAKHLIDPRVKSRGVQGYPGALTVEELEECVSITRVKLVCFMMAGVAVFLSPPFHVFASTSFFSFTYKLLQFKMLWFILSTNATSYL
jgi:hypothetical protein